MLQRQREIEEEIIHETHAPDGQPRGSGTGDPTARKVEKILQRQRENDKKIRAVEQAWMRCDSDDEREFIKQNLFRHKQMQFINLPFSIITMKRYRKTLFNYLAEELREI